MVLAGAWAGLVLAGAWRHRPPSAPARLAAPPGWRLKVGPRGHRVVPALVVVLLVAPVAPVVAPLAGAAVWLLLVRRRRRVEARLVTASIQRLPEVVDLFALAVAAGHNVPGAVAAVAARHQGPLGDELAEVAREVRLGRRCADALDDLPTRSGEGVRPLVAALTASERYGAPLADGLARLAEEVRADRRRHAESEARRVPVKLLFPLVCCVLPAFGLLTVAPLLAGAFDALRP